MLKKNFFLIDCSKAADSCDKAQYQEAGTLDRIKMLIHLLYCSRCRDYTVKNTRLTKLLKKAGIKTCTAQEKQRWKEKIEGEMTKTQH